MNNNKISNHDDLGIEIMDDFIIMDNPNQGIQINSSPLPAEPKVVSNPQKVTTHNPQINFQEEKKISSSSNQGVNRVPPVPPNQGANRVPPVPLNQGANRVPPVPPNQGENINEEESFRKSKKGIFIGLTLAVVLIAATIIFVYFLKANNPKQLLINGFEELGENLEFITQPLKNSSTLLEGSKIRTGEVSFHLDVDIPEDSFFYGDEEEQFNQVIDSINKTKIDYTYQRDLDGHKELFNLFASTRNQKLFDIDVFFVNNKYYLLLKDIFDKYIELEDFETVDTKSIKENFDNYKYLWGVIKKSLIKNLDDSYLEVDTAEVKVEGEKETLKKLTLNLNDNNQRRLFKNIYLDLKKDKKAFEILTSYYQGIEDFDIDKFLDELPKSNDLLLSMYFREKTIIKVELMDVIEKASLVYIKNNNIETIEFLRAEKNYFWNEENFTYDEEITDKIISEFKITIKKDKERFTITIQNEGDIIITINGKQEVDNYDYSWSVINEDFSFTGRFVLNYEKVNKNEYKVKSNWAFKLATEDEVTVLFKIKDEGKVSSGAKIKDKVTTSVLSSDLTDEELQKIYNELMIIGSKFLPYSEESIVNY